MRKWNGDDAYSWALFLDGSVAFSGMCHIEARNERRAMIDRLARRALRVA